jgi:hypothetical protein
MLRGKSWKSEEKNVGTVKEPNYMYHQITIKFISVVPRGVAYIVLMCGRFHKSEGFTPRGWAAKESRCWGLPLLIEREGRPKCPENIYPLNMGTSRKYHNGFNNCQRIVMLSHLERDWYKYRISESKLHTFTVNHLFFASILFGVYRIQCLFANTKIREGAFKKKL